MLYIKLFGIALFVFLIIDLLWLGIVAKSLYAHEFGSMLKSKPNYFAAAIFYVIFIVALVVFVLAPNIEAGKLTNVILLGALFGLVTYATYDLTNLATLQNFSLKIVIIDIAWGVFLSTSTSVITYYIYRGIWV